MRQLFFKAVENRNLKTYNQDYYILLVLRQIHIILLWSDKDVSQIALCPIKTVFAVKQSE